ncbi:MAG: 2-oxoglutarate dehydrogenase, E2 component, dihydrolipoamide succinyltransferase [Gemmatimonadales bacterium]
MARVDVIMPQMGESIAEGTVSRWLKQVGDEVKRDEPLLEISTDKVDAEIPSPSGGKLVEIKVGEGETVEVQTVVAVIETDVDAVVTDVAPAPTPAKEPEEPKQRELEPPPPVAEPVRIQTSAPAIPGDGSTATTVEERLRTKSTPLVRKIAAEHQVDLAQIRGTGHAGRVTKKDILGYIESRGVAVVVERAAAPRAPALLAGVSHPSVEAWPGDRVEPMSRIRKLTADHMVTSKRISAHVTTFYEIDYTRVAELRKAKKAEYAGRGVKLTYLSFIAKAVADALGRHPVLNCSVSGDSIIYRHQINLGIAVALEWGLIVPVIRNADELSVLGLSKAIVDLAERARTKRLNPDEVQNGTFTITNPGTFGSTTGTPIINQPQVAILGIGSIEKCPKVITLEDGQDVIAIRTMGILSLAFDHRVVDGADGDRFLSDVKETLENFPDGAL